MCCVLEHAGVMCKKKKKKADYWFNFFELAILSAEHGARLRQIKHPAKQLSKSYNT